MWEGRAQAARREIAALATSGLGVEALHAAAIEVVGDVVGNELTCWAALDPGTLVISSMTGGRDRIPAEYEPRLAETEYAGDVPNSFADLARRAQPVARLSDLPYREVVGHRRLNEVWRPLGIDHEVRTMFMVDGDCWGAAGFVRSGADFSDRELDFLTAVAPAIGAATRVAVRTDAHGYRGGAGPSIVVTGPDGEPRAVTAAARSWQDELDLIAPGRFGVLLRAVVTGTRATRSGTFQARVQAASGGWVLLQGSRLIGDDDSEVVVTIEPASGRHLVGMLLAAYGLTAREREICLEVISGRTTAEIADRLTISPHTIQDHLKAAFTKVGVRSRGELVATLRPDDLTTGC
ncbi:helix-turn-helix transcriptional regulator [Kribbella sandramycini]|uniref:DNA-binding CsgD family transcriptional regulator n=1 Tax=Kribbella sandramycini TaxID=60450 RepID=A0A7Y4KVT0_9ACTN|nr:LuxR C-terminal-related transcriptional regulator [Kribbella sandramycini]MBB6567916.1 DNA-binding CsgD family transcriptional regulator [Kribbella sandramycini]NOL39489.1 helix-turn-helix transcriptional regulator [Kribbella sandramycini]